MSRRCPRPAPVANRCYQPVDKLGQDRTKVRTSGADSRADKRSGRPAGPGLVRSPATRHAVRHRASRGAARDRLPRGRTGVALLSAQRAGQVVPRLKHQPAQRRRRRPCAPPATRRPPPASPRSCSIGNSPLHHGHPDLDGPLLPDPLDHLEVLRRVRRDQLPLRRPARTRRSSPRPARSTARRTPPRPPTRAALTSAEGRAARQRTWCRLPEAVSSRASSAPSTPSSAMPCAASGSRKRPAQLLVDRRGRRSRRARPAAPAAASSSAWSPATAAKNRAHASWCSLPGSARRSSLQRALRPAARRPPRATRAPRSAPARSAPRCAASAARRCRSPGPRTAAPGR